MKTILVILVSVGFSLLTNAQENPEKKTLPKIVKKIDCEHNSNVDEERKYVQKLTFDIDENLLNETGLQEESKEYWYRVSISQSDQTKDRKNSDYDGQVHTNNFQTQVVYRHHDDTETYTAILHVGDTPQFVVITIIEKEITARTIDPFSIIEDVDTLDFECNSTN